MKKTTMTVFAVAAVAAGAVLAAIPVRSRTGAGAAARAAAPQAAAAAQQGQILVEQWPKTGRATQLAAPSLQGGTTIGQCYTKRRNWIVMEAKYKTLANWTDQLVFTWHVLLETNRATEKDAKDVKALPPYSYFNQTVTYVNIPRGSHAASVVLPPSYLERYGEPVAIGLVITTPDGTVLAGDTVSEISGIKQHMPFWENQQLMGQRDKAGNPVIERRQGLVDRSKTIWALVNPNDYETVAQ